MQTAPPTFEFETGPDGRQYATGGGEVSGDPEANVRKVQAIKIAALAPREPSGQDRQVAAQAPQLKPKPDSKFKPRKRKKEKKPVKKILKKAPLQKQTHKKLIQVTKKQESTNDTSPEESPFSRHIKNQFSASSNPSSGNLLNIVS
jgi:hypothetical protein